METIGVKVLKDMKVTHITYTRRFNLEGFEHEDITLATTLEDGDTDLIRAVTELQATTIKASILTKRKQKQKEKETQKNG